jgi:hypothetical protein
VNGFEALRAPIRFTAFSACSMRHGNYLGFDFRHATIGTLRLTATSLLKLKSVGAAPVISRAPRLNVKS